MSITSPRHKHKGFINPELLHMVALFSLSASLIFPLARRFHWHPLVTLGVLVGAYGCFVLCLNFQNLKEDFLHWLKNKK